MSNRKYPRLSDGYHERSPLHPYQASSKYTGKTNSNCAVDGVRDRSPTNSSGRNSRDNSPYSSTNRNSSPRSHRSKYSTYRTKDTNKRGSSESPIESSRERPVSKFNHISTSEEFPWSQHVSSSGKIYYYNFKTEKSQWEKPKEWLEREKREKDKVRQKQLAMAESKDKDHISARDSNKSSKYTSAKIPSSREQYSNEKYSEDHPRHTNHSNSLDRHPVVKTTSAYTSAMSTGSHSNRSTPVATNPSVSPAGSLQDVSPPSTPSSRPSVYDANVHTASPQLISLSPHPTQFTPTQSPQLLQQHLQRHMPAQVSYPVTQGTVSSTQLHNMQSSYTQYGLVNNGNQEHENCTAQPSISQQSQKNHYEVLAAQPALHPLQQATLLHQRQLTEAKHSTMPHHYASQSVSTQMSTSAIAWEDNRASNSGSPGLLPHTSATSKEQLPGLSGTHMPQISVQASSSPYGSLSSQPSPTVNLQALNKFVDKSLTNHVVGWVTEGAEKQIQRLSEEGSSNANDANKTIIEQFQLHSQLNLLELRLDLGTKRLASLKEVTKTLEFLLAESDKKSLT